MLKPLSNLLLELSSGKLSAVFIAALTTGVLAPSATGEQNESIDFNRQIRPLLSDHCFACHGPDETDRKGGLRLDTLEGATALSDGVRAVDVAQPERSALLLRVAHEDPDELMPPPEFHKPLRPKDKALLQRWIEQGAPWAEHWAFEAPVKATVPSLEGVDQEARSNPIDAFVGVELKRHGLQTAEEADRATLLRRVCFDLTGLPPTPEQIAVFMQDEQPGAYERLVDRLLQTPAYGERMAVTWMDLARYGDSSVMHADGPRQMWPWRDWVIDSYNGNKPFDVFTVEQLAGDLLPEATVQQRIASGFNRNHATSDEGGAIPEELRVEYIVDRVQTTANVWMALTMECSQCHEHKYDPITQREYYQFYAFFNNNADPGMQTRKGNQAPVAEFFSPEQEAKLETLKGELAAAEKQRDDRREAVLPGFPAWEAEARAATEIATGERETLRHHFTLDEDPGAALVDRVTGVEAKPEGGKLVEAVRDALDRGIKLDGRAFATFEGADPLEHDQPITLAAWIKVGKKEANGAVFGRMDVAASHRGWDLWLQGNRIGTHLIHKWPENALKVVTDQPLKPDAWHHVCVTYDGKGKAKGLEIWVDGKKQKTRVEKDTLSASIKPNVPLKIGGRSTGSMPVCEVDDIRIYAERLDEPAIAEAGRPSLDRLLALSSQERSPEQQERLEAHFLNQADEGYRKAVQRLERSQQEIAKVEAAKLSSMIMGDKAGEPRPTYILERGAYDSPREDEVIPVGVPAMLPAMPDGAPPNRLGLANWLTLPEHPLTARVAVNRYWMMFFGEGLVRTESDFGSQGEPPTHPELLDWLAVDFIESGWDVKRMIRQIVTSQTYRQSSRITPSALERDPENRLLARGPRFRLLGEFIRDNALSVSGLLNPEVGGPSVKPYQPDGLWNEVSLSGNVRFVQDKDEKLYRRSLYTYWKRSSPHPGLTTFDAPSREKCVIQRQRTNTPLQALVTLNDVQFVEASRFFAERLIREGGDTLPARLDHAYRLLLARSPQPEEVAVLTQLYQEQLKEFRAEPAKADAFLAVGDKPRDASLDAPELAALAVVGNLLLNLDEVLNRG